MRDLRRTSRVVALVAVASLLAGACGDDDTADTTTSTSTVPDSSTTSASTTTAPTTSTSTGSGSEGIPDADLPGEPFGLSPAAGRALAVVGVRFDDTLNVREVPGTDGEVIATLEPTSTDAVATGRARTVAESIWWEVTTVDGLIGWIASSFTAQLGPTTDTTAAVIATLGATPEEASVQDLGFLVADTVDTDPDVPTDLVIVVAADETGDLAEVTIDVIGLGDDALRGVRLHVFGTPLESGDAFALKSVEATDLCDPTRGPAAPGDVCA